MTHDLHGAERRRMDQFEGRPVVITELIPGDELEVSYPTFGHFHIGV